MTSNVTEVTTVTGSNSRLPVVALLVQRLRRLSGAGNGAPVAVIWILREAVLRVSLGRLVNDQGLEDLLASRRDAQSRNSVTLHKRAHVCTAERITQRRIAQIQRSSSVVP